jgi:CheY-like chemotaxis protein
MARVLQGYENVSAAEFAQSLAESGLLDSAMVEPGAAPNGAAAARKLIEAGKLTGFQAAAVLGRRFDELRIGNYEVLDRLGAGGMGTVFKARHRRMKRVVALKVLSATVSESMAGRFQREVETIARLTHPNIVMAHDADEAEVGPFLVMEFVDGQDLVSEVEQRGPLPVADAIDRVLQAARGLDYAHKSGIVHRDIKPGNILRARDGVVKVADLGLARLSVPDAVAQTALTQTGTVFGTAEFMSPEQAVDAGQVDARADVYSLGCTLYFLLTGRSPYPGASLMAVLLKHRDEPIPWLSAVRSDVPPELEVAFRKMVAKAPADRFASMADVVTALEHVPAPAAPVAAPAPDTTGFWTAPPVALPAPAANTAVLDPAGKAHDTVGFEMPPSVPAPAGGAAGLTVVLAEPSRTQAGIIRRYLQQLGAAVVHTTATGREALELARRERAAVVVSSMHLSDMTGAQLAAAVLADPGCAATGFVLATSEADAQEPGSVPTGPRVTVMPKPFDPDRLARSIAAVVR